jgi:outer membrane receptor protein involved in Fe transport
MFSGVPEPPASRLKPTERPWRGNLTVAWQLFSGGRRRLPPIRRRRRAVADRPLPDFGHEGFLMARNQRFEVQFDLYNLLNSNPVTALNSTYGTAWLRPINILPGRLAKFGIQWEF